MNWMTRSECAFRCLCASGIETIFILSLHSFKIDVSQAQRNNFVVYIYVCVCVCGFAPRRAMQCAMTSTHLPECHGWKEEGHACTNSAQPKTEHITHTHTHIVHTRLYRDTFYVMLSEYEFLSHRDHNSDWAAYFREITCHLNSASFTLMPTYTCSFPHGSCSTIHRVPCANIILLNVLCYLFYAQCTRTTCTRTTCTRTVEHLVASCLCTCVASYRNWFAII